VANYAGMQRSPKIGFAQPSEFMPALVGAGEVRDKESAADTPILLADPEAQSRLLKMTLFKIKEN
jgi:hypothetical protein